MAKLSIAVQLYTLRDQAAAALNVLAGIVEQDDSYDLTPWQSVEASLNNL